MIRLRSLLRDTRGGSAAEFALVTPLVVLFLLGIVDAGRLAWEINRAEKATQIGARWAAVTDMVPGGLRDYSFATSGTVVQAGTPVPASLFPGVSCSSNGTTTTCSCAASGSCAFPLTVDTSGSANFSAIVNRMSGIKSGIAAANVVIDYNYSGLGFAGDPNGPDVAPIISVKLRNLQFQPLLGILFKANIPLPDFSYSLTMEDGLGTASN